MDYAAEKARVSMEVNDILNAVEGPEDVDEAFRLIDDIRRRFPINPKREALYRMVKGMIRRNANGMAYDRGTGRGAQSTDNTTGQ